MTLCSTRTIIFVGIAGMLSAAGGTRAATLSFASDDDSSAFTLVGTQNGPNSFSIQNGRTPAFTPVTLRIDDNNMSQPTFSVAAGLLMNLTATYAGSIGTGTQTHIYNITGSYSFVKASDGSPLVTVQVNSGSSLTVGGTATTWGSAGSMFGSDAAAGNISGVDYTTGPLQTYMSSQGANPALYGFSFANIMEDFGFTMTVVNNDQAMVAIDPLTHIPSFWQSESSYSGHVVGIPAPGAAGAMAAAGLMTLRRRRR